MRVCLCDEQTTHSNVKINSSLLFCVFVSLGIFENSHLAGAETAASQQEVDRHLELGKQFLVAGQLSDALTHYHAAVGEYRKMSENWSSFH